MNNIFFGETSNILEVCTKSVLLKDDNYMLTCHLTINTETKLFFQAEFSYSIRPNKKTAFETLFYLRKLISGKSSDVSYDEIDIILSDIDLDNFINNPEESTIPNVYKKVVQQKCHSSCKKISSLMEIAHLNVFDSKMTDWILIQSNMNFNKHEIDKMLKKANMSINNFV